MRADFARGFGDCKDKATLIVTMLNALGIKATPVVVRTAFKGDFETSPASLAPFDHMIAYVPSLDVYLDGTAEYTGSLELPAMDRGALAFQVNEGSPKLVHLPQPPASDSVNAHRLEATLTADGGAQIDWRTEVSGFQASEWRVRFHAVATRKQRAQQLIAADMPGGEVTGVETGNLEDIEQKVTMRVRGKVPAFARVDNDGLKVPLGVKEHMVRDYAPQASRKLDVNLIVEWTDEDEWTVHLPAGAKVKAVPVPSKGSSPFGAYEVSVDSSGGTLRVKTRVTMSKSRVTPGEYPAFRAWCEEVDRALGSHATVVVR